MNAREIKRERAVVDLMLWVLHYEGTNTRAGAGASAGGVTLCGVRFVPRSGHWTTAGPRIRALARRKKVTLCPICKAELFEIAGKA